MDCAGDFASDGKVRLPCWREREQGAMAMVVDLATAFELVSRTVVWPWATHFKFPRQILRVLCGHSEHRRRVQFEGCVAEPRETITAILLASKWSCLLLRSVLQDTLGEVTKVYPPPKIEGVCG